VVHDKDNRTSDAAAAALTLLAAFAACTNESSGGASCSLGYDGGLQALPASAESADCTVAIVGATNQAAYYCPATSKPYDEPCVPVSDAPDLPVAVREGPTGPGVPSYCWVDFADSDGHDTASNLQSWLGGSGFSYTITCGGNVVVQMDGQSMGQFCFM
jgi:hypothetical protein